MRYTTAALLVAALITLPCVAEEKGPAGAPKNPGQAFDFQKQLLQKFDLNKDGVLSNEEKMRMQTAGGMAAGFPGAEEFLKKFDLNRDGKLNDAEKMAGLQALQKMRAQGGGPVSGGPIGVGGNHFPAGGAPEGVQPKGKPEKVNALVKRFDKDGDGKLNAEEKAAAQAELKKAKTKKDKEPAAKPE